MNLDDYVISVVQIPPGYSSKTLLDTNNPQVEKFLKKFMKRLVKKPGTLFSRVLPTSDVGCESLNLCVNDTETTYIPYAMRGGDSSWYIRQFPTHRLSIRALKNEKDCIILEEDKPKPSSKPSSVAAATASSSSSSLKRAFVDREPSPQFIISSDEEDASPVAKSRRID
ncbi:unnamed protein product [Trichobilharzia szidati]|nr:unnamed protein product [Trichobilharzia szidati]